MLLFFYLLVTINVAKSLNVDSLITKANIYYQRPLHLGAPTELPMENVNELSTKQNIKVIIHGFTGSRNHESISPLRNAYMANDFDNIFMADWADAAGLDYHSSRKAVGKVAIYFGKILNDFFNKHNIDLTEVHIIGHSLGAHIAGGIGQFFNSSLGRVTGLDPALPLFTPHAGDSLHAAAAKFVDVVHTDSPIFGDLTPRGRADFYPNFGYAPQPGCADIDLIAASKLIFQAYSCSHNRAVLFYAESIGLPKSFAAMPCSLNGIKLRSVSVCQKKWTDNYSNVDGNQTALSNVDSQAVYMGEFVSLSASGIYYFETYDAPPYGKGVYTNF